MTLISTLSAFSARVAERVQKTPRTKAAKPSPNGSENGHSHTDRVRGGLLPIVFPTDGTQVNGATVGSPSNDPRASKTNGAHKGRVPIARRAASGEVWSEESGAEFPLLSQCSGRWVRGNLGRACLQTGVRESDREVCRLQGPAMVFDSEEHFLRSFDARELERDFIAIVRFQGRRAQGANRQLVKTIAALKELRDRGFEVALVTDGRAVAGGSGVPVADQLVPEAMCNGTLRRLVGGDLVRIDCEAGQLQLMVDEQRILARDPAAPELQRAELEAARCRAEGLG